MPYGYLGQNQPNQTVSNSGVFSITDVAELQSQGKLGGSLEIIEEQTFTGLSVVDFNAIKESKYDVHYLTLENIQHTSANKLTYLQFFESGVLETASVYQYAEQYGKSDGTFGELKNTADSRIYLTFNDNGTVAGDLESGYVYLYNLGNSSKYSFLTYQAPFMDNGVFCMSFGGGVSPQASVVDGIRVNFDTASTDGTIKLYGVKQI